MESDKNLENFLLIDASSPTSTLVGLLGENGKTWRAFDEEKSPALEGIFVATEKVLGSRMPAGFIFCAGPGSILGIRIAAMAIRAWCACRWHASVPVLAYQSLRLHVALITRAFPQEKDFAVLAESRLNCWNVLGVRAGAPEKKICEIKSDVLAQSVPEKVFLLPQRRAGTPTLNAPATPFSPARFLENDAAVFAETPALLTPCDEAPDALNTADPDSYAKWTPARHKSPDNIEKIHE